MAMEVQRDEWKVLHFARRHPHYRGCQWISNVHHQYDLNGSTVLRQGDCGYDIECDEPRADSPAYSRHNTYVRKADELCVPCPLLACTPCASRRGGRVDCPLVTRTFHLCLTLASRPWNVLSGKPPAHPHHPPPSSSRFSGIVHGYC